MPGLAAVDDGLLEFSVDGVRICDWEDEMAAQRSIPTRTTFEIKIKERHVIPPGRSTTDHDEAGPPSK